jgi:hypothetical protein
MFPQRRRLAQEGSKPEEDKKMLHKKDFQGRDVQEGFSRPESHDFAQGEREGGRERGSESAVCVREAYIHTHPKSGPN